MTVQSRGAVVLVSAVVVLVTCFASAVVAQAPQSELTVSMQYVDQWSAVPRDQRGPPGSFDALSERGPIEPGTCEEHGGVSFYNLEEMQQVEVIEQAVQVIRHRPSGVLYLALGFGERENRWWNIFIESYTLGNCLYRIRGQ